MLKRDLFAITNRFVYIYSELVCAGNVFQEEEYFKCVVQEPVMSTWQYAYNRYTDDMFRRMMMYSSWWYHSCSFTTAELSQRCSYVSPIFSLIITLVKCVL